MVIGTIVRAQLQGDCTKNDVEDTQCRNPNQAYRTVREEVLEQILAARQASTNDDPDISKSGGEVFFGHRVLPIANISRGRGLVPR